MPAWISPLLTAVSGAPVLLLVVALVLLAVLVAVLVAVLFGPSDKPAARAAQLLYARRGVAPVPAPASAPAPAAPQPTPSRRWWRRLPSRSS